MRLTALVLAAALTACGGHRTDPDDVVQADFKGGTCLVLADELVLLRGYAKQDLVDHPQDPPIDAAEVPFLHDEATRFRQGLARADDDVTPALTAVVAALDELSRRLDTGTYAGPEPLTRVRDAAGTLIEACT